MEKALDIAGPCVTNTLVIRTKGFVMKVSFAERLASVLLAALLVAPLAYAALRQASLIVV